MTASASVARSASSASSWGCRSSLAAMRSSSIASSRFSLYESFCGASAGGVGGGAEAGGAGVLRAASAATRAFSSRAAISCHAL